jgi:hypothetical protein
MTVTEPCRSGFVCPELFLYRSRNLHAFVNRHNGGAQGATTSQLLAQPLVQQRRVQCKLCSKCKNHPGRLSVLCSDSGRDLLALTVHCAMLQRLVIVQQDPSVTVTACATVGCRSAVDQTTDQTPAHRHT